MDYKNELQMSHLERMINVERKRGSSKNRLINTSVFKRDQTSLDQRKNVR